MYKVLITVMRFIYIGVKNDNEDYINDKIKIFNFQNIILIVELLFSVVLFLFIGNYRGMLGFFLVIPGIIVGFYFVKNHQYTTAKIFSFLNYNFCIFAIILYYSHPALNYFYLPILVALPMNFHYKELKSLGLLILFTLFLFIIGISPLSIYIPKFYADTNPDHSTLVLQVIFIIHVINLIIAFVIYTNISHNRLKKTGERLIKSKKKLILQNNDIQSFSLASSQFIRSPIYVLNYQ